MTDATKASFMGQRQLSEWNDDRYAESRSHLSLNLGAYRSIDYLRLIGTSLTTLGLREIRGLSTRVQSTGVSFIVEKS